MKFVATTIVWILMLASCREISFPEAQPSDVKALNKVPSELVGRYLSYDKKSGDESDTLIIETWGYHFVDKEGKEWLNRGTLSDTLVLKWYKGYYFVNFKVEDQWILRLIKQKPSGAVEFMSIDINDDEKRKEILKKISKKLEIKEIDINGDLFYQIRPTPSQLMELINEGFFTGDTLDKLR